MTKYPLLLAALLSTAITHASDDALPEGHGEKVHEVHCFKCHTDSVYTREDRFVKSLTALSKQVVRCRDANDVPWYDEDTDAVVRFLNSKYYRF